MRGRYGGFLSRAVYIVVISPWMSFAALKLYVGHRNVVFICRSVVERFNCKWLLYSYFRPCVWELCRCGTEKGRVKYRVNAAYVIINFAMNSLGREFLPDAPFSMWDLAQVQGYILEWLASDWRYSVAHPLSRTLCLTAVASPQRAPMALIAAISRGHPWPSWRQYPEGTMALIVAISGGHPWPSLRQYPEGTHGPHCGNIWRAPMALIVATSGEHSLALYQEGTHQPS